MASNWIGSVLGKTKARLWNDLSLRAKGLIVVSLPVAALLLSVLTITQVEKQKDKAEELVKRTQDVRTEILNSYIVLISAESAVRAYALTGHEEGLRAFDTAGASSDVVLERINHLVQDNPEQIKRVEHLKVLIHQQLDGLKSLRAFYDSPDDRGAEAPHALLRQASVAMTTALRELTTLFTVENRLLQDRSKRSKDRQATLSTVIYASVGVGLLGGIVSMLLFTTGIVRRVQRVESIGHQLEQGLPLVSHSDGNDELGRLARISHAPSVVE